ncbi:MAG: ATP-binding cassette domain-containing protein [Bacteroidales bacterium]|nr:ATP-binding cassette domain-containing protein [Bacteroidales bacterium]
MNQILTIEHISKSYGTKVALDDVSFPVHEGTILGLLGPNGAGKTTLIRIINQIYIADKGKVYFRGKPIRTDDIISFGYLPEERGLYKKMKVGEQAIYLAQLKGLSRRQALVELKYWFDKFDIASWWDKKIEELSKGMQQKVQFIISVLHKPSVLIFDEPFSGFDPINANLIKEELLAMKKNGVTIMLSTHNMASVEELCDEIVLINSSKNVLNGNVLQIKQQFKEHIYEVVFKGFVNYIDLAHRHQYEIIENKQEFDNQIVKLKLLDTSIKSNTLLQALLDVGEIVSFRELLPSMDEIFIKVVKQTNNQ